VFFYHALTAILGINAVYYSAYILMALVFLLSGAVPVGRWRALLTGFFTAMMILLASKLLLVVLVVVFAAYLWRYRNSIPRSRVQGLVSLVVMVLGMLAFTNNPVVGRYKAILPEDQSAAAGFNGISLRLFIWRSAKEILTREHAWLCGISAGDGQDRLNQCYLDTGMSVGYLDYNFHNEYVEVLVDDGVAGLMVFFVVLGVLGREARRTMEGLLVLLLIGVLAGTESILEMQQSVFLACFFPMLPWGLRKRLAND
jgi:O-antigen ligase